MNRENFVYWIEQNAARVMRYELGKDGTDGGCDCIGLLIGALRMSGQNYPGTHGSNYAARYATRDLRRVQSVQDLRLGDAVYKCREQGDAGYALPDTYRDHPDQRDYYHVGVVTSLAPFTVTHCSTGGIHRDGKPGAWAYVGTFRGVEESSTPGWIESPNGGKVNLRATPSLSGKRLVLLESGTQVQLHEQAAENWLRVTAEGVAGYVHRDYVTTQPCITLSLPRDTARALLQALKSSLDACD